MFTSVLFTFAFSCDWPFWAAKMGYSIEQQYRTNPATTTDYWSEASAPMGLELPAMAFGAREGFLSPSAVGGNPELGFVEIQTGHAVWLGILGLGNPQHAASLPRGYASDKKLASSNKTGLKLLSRVVERNSFLFQQLAIALEDIE
jgi:hypothetical protein